MTHRTFERPDRRYCRWAPLLYQIFTEEYTNPRERILGSYKAEDGTLPESVDVYVTAVTKSGGYVVVERQQETTDLGFVINKEWRWKHVALNGQAIAGSLEGYRNRAYAIKQALEYAARYCVPLYVVSEHPVTLPAEYIAGLVEGVTP